MRSIVKRFFVFIVVILMWTLPSCSFADQTMVDENCTSIENDFSKYDIRNYIPNYDLHISENNTLAIISKNNIEWLYLSIDGDSYDDNRSKIEEYEHELIMAIEEISPQKLPLKIALVEYDVNHDGVEEIIAFHNGDGGAKDAGILMVYFQDWKKETIVSSIRIVGSPDIDVLNDQGIGIIERKVGTSDFIILNKLYIWDGANWN